jgi:head-tail adaptor
MSIGERRERITIRRKTRTQRTDGGYDTTVADLATRFASVRPVRERAGESEQAGRKRGTVTYLIECDARGTDCVTDDLIVWATNGDIVLNVREVRRPMGRTLPLTIVAESGVVNGG